MRKTIATTDSLSGTPHRNWLDLEHLAQVEVTSEGAAHPIESALRAGDPGVWCASTPGVQTIRLHFDAPQSLERIRLVVDETERARTQEFELRWYALNEKTSRHIVRQQYTFSPTGATREIEEYIVDLHGVSVLELQIVPDINGGEARARLSEWLLA